ncbi:alginate export family protein [uncultured Pseudoalteromonas sp.]|uniref:alginate export family protein n=1 Tax=uncultured Pseudoalteromonas sp. TaxID=114053 RepID=UPI0025843B94|nr:alginate export family protein [uncultured Pseudoalteromonas sp.]
MKLTRVTLSILTLISANQAFAAVETELGTLNADFRLRYESVDQDNALKDASALTLRSLGNFKTKTFAGVSAFIELENTLAVIDDYNNGIGDGTEYSVVADPKSTEIDQLYLAYNTEQFSAKLGRQVITLDNHRFVGHVGWRQDKQTFDAFSARYEKDAINASYAYINKRNRIFADEKDLDSKDHLFNASLKTDFGKLIAYGYLLEVDNNTENSLDTYGVRLVGKKNVAELPVSYSAEYALQSNDSGANSYDTQYLLLESSVTYRDITYKLGYESLGSDKGEQAFQTPLATLHKFNGWADQFLTTPAAGLQDLYASLSGNAFSGKWSLVYHTYSADESLAGDDDLGSEFDVVYSKSFNKQYSLGVKYAAYMAGDEAFAKVDTNKLWVWVGAKF